MSEQETIDRVSDAIRENLLGVYYCNRVWEAWFVGTMSHEDFIPLEDCEDVIQNITSAVVAALKTAPPISEANHG